MINILLFLYNEVMFKLWKNINIITFNVAIYHLKIMDEIAYEERDKLVDKKD